MRWARIFYRSYLNYARATFALKKYASLQREICFRFFKWSIFIFIFRNIFLTNEEHIKLGDLGISIEVGTDTTSEISSNIGTDAYKSPEIKNGDQYSFKTDIW